MNEKFDRLLYESGLTAQGCWDQMDSYDKEAILKFARLIIRDCIQVGGPEDSYSDVWFEAKANSVLKIKQHFGVEE